MDTNLDIRHAIMNLWKNTFHDSKEYISLVFNSYFEEGIYVYKEVDNRIVASILGVPYEFAYNEIKLRGLYLCGISTEPEYRRKGIMTQLLHEIEEKSKDKYDFLFLIPSNENNRLIYEDKGFYNAIYKIYEYYTSVHDFNAEFESILFQFNDKVRKLKKDLFESLEIIKLEEHDIELRDNIIEFILKFEKEKKSYLNLLHSRKDLEAVIEDNFLSRGNIFLSLNKNNEITAVMFTTSSPDGRIKVYAQFCNDPCSYFKILEKIKKIYLEMSLTVVRIPEEVHESSLWSETSIVPNPDGSSLESLIGIETRAYYSAENALPYGMIKVLNLNNIIKVIASLRKDISFKLILSGEKGETMKYIEVANGKCNLKDLTGNLSVFLNKHKDCSILSYPDFMDMIFRKKTKDDIIMEAFGIPRLPVNISLMLD